MSVEKRVKEIVAEQLGVDEAQVTNEASFMDDLGADSLDTVELVMASGRDIRRGCREDPDGAGCRGLHHRARLVVR